MQFRSRAKFPVMTDHNHNAEMPAAPSTWKELVFVVLVYSMKYHLFSVVVCAGLLAFGIQQLAGPLDKLGDQWAISNVQGEQDRAVIRDLAKSIEGRTVAIDSSVKALQDLVEVIKELLLRVKAACGDEFPDERVGFYFGP